MPRGKYNIGESISPAKDNSFRSCVCTLLVFFAICMICILSTYPWMKTSKKTHSTVSPEYVHGSDGWKGDKDSGTDDDNNLYNYDYLDNDTAPIVYSPTNKIDETTVQIPTTTVRSIIATTSTTENITKENYPGDKSNEDKTTDRTEETTVENMPYQTTPTLEIDIRNKDDTDAQTDQEVESFVTEYSTNNTKEQIIAAPTVNPTEELTATTLTIYYEPTENIANGTYSGDESNEDKTTDTPEVTTAENMSDQTTPVLESDIRNKDDTDAQKEQEVEFLGTENSTNNTKEQIIAATIENSTEELTTSKITEATEKGFETEKNSGTIKTGEEVTDITTDATTNTLDEIKTSVSTIEASELRDLNEAEFTKMTTSKTTISENQNTETKNQSTIYNEGSDITTENYKDLKQTTVINDEKEDSEEFIKSTPRNEDTTEQNIKDSQNNDLDSFPINETVTKIEDKGTTIKPEVTIAAHSRTSRETVDDKQIYTAKAMSSTVLPPLLSHFKQQAPVCTTSGCKSIATRMLSQINHFVDPCEDFYEYACGGYNFDNDEDKNWKRIARKLQAINDNSPTYLKVYKNVYDNCISYHEDYNYENRLLTVKDIFYALGDLYDRTQKVTREMNVELLANLLKADIAPLFDVSMGIDDRTGRFIFQMDVGRRSNLLKLNSKDKLKKKCFKQQIIDYPSDKVDLNAAYKKYVECEHNYGDYLNTVHKALKFFGAFSHVEAFNCTQYINDIKGRIESEVLSKYMELPSIAQQKKDKRDRKYSILDISELNEHFNFINWSDLFSMLVGKPVDPKTKVQIYYFDQYFKKLFDDFGRFMDERNLNNVLMGMFAEELYTNFVLPISVENVDKYCLQYTSKLLKDVSSSMYLDTWTDKDITTAQLQLNQTFVSLKTNLVSLMDEAEWLEDDSKNSLKVKTEKIELLSDGDFGIWRNESFLNERVEVVENVTVYPHQVFALVNRDKTYYYDLLGQSALDSNNLRWLYTAPYDIKPVSIYSLGIVVAPIGLALNLPTNIPQYVKLARLDYTLARAIGHQFDSVGIKYKTSLSHDEKMTYEAMQQCGDDKYSYTKDQTIDSRTYKYQMDGSLFLNERIAEDIALKIMEQQLSQSKIINDKLLEWISNTHSREKIVFLALAQDHCKKRILFDEITDMFESEYATPTILVESFLTNSEKFSQAYGCSQGSRMNPVLKCYQFPLLMFEEEPEQEYDTNVH